MPEQFEQLLRAPQLQAQRELTPVAALRELDATVPLLQLMAREAEAGTHKNGVAIARRWNPLVRTYTYHTHVVVPGVDATVLAPIVEQFYNAYALQRQDWYSQFVRGETYPLPVATAVRGRHQIGQGYFDFGVGEPRVYHTLFSALALAETATYRAHAVVLRTIDTPMTPLQPAKSVYLLPPTGDVFSFDGNNLHWHHICTTNGVRVLPDKLDAWLMNFLRYMNWDSKERSTYLHEGEGFIAFAKSLC